MKKKTCFWILCICITFLPVCKAGVSTAVPSQQASLGGHSLGENSLESMESLESAGPDHLITLLSVKNENPHICRENRAPDFFNCQKISDQVTGVVLLECEVCSATKTIEKKIVKFIPVTSKSFAAERRGSSFVRDLKLPPIAPIMRIDKVRHVAGEDSPLIVTMDRANGGDLKSYIDKRLREGHPFIFSEILFVRNQVLDALRILHIRDVYHRDVKPQNIVLDWRDGFERNFLTAGDVILKLIDFESLSSPHFSTDGCERRGEFEGTVEYMDFKAIRGEHDEESDENATAVVLYQMATGYTDLFHNFPKEGIGREINIVTIVRAIKETFSLDREGLERHLKGKLSKIKDRETIELIFNTLHLPSIGYGVGPAGSAEEDLLPTGEDD